MSKVLLTWQATNDEIELFRDALPAGTEVVAQKAAPCVSRFDATFASIAEDAADADAIVAFVMPEGIVDVAHNLKLICWMHAGLTIANRPGDDELHPEVLKERGIKVVNMRGANSVPVAEQAMTLMLAITKRLREKHEAVQAGVPIPFQADGHRGGMLEGKTLAVVGLGSIGEAVAKRAQAFDMNVLGVRRHPERGGNYVDSVYGPADLLSVVRQSDYIVLSTPILVDTEAMIGEAEIAAMKPTAYLINVGRPSTVDEYSLDKALREGRIAGYASDVWWVYDHVYPASFMASRTGLHALPNVLASGDQSHNTEGYFDRIYSRAIESLAALFEGKPLEWEVNLDLKY